MSLIPNTSFAAPGVPLFVKMFRSTEAEISTLYASTIYVGHTFVSSIDVVGGDFKISNTSSIFDIYVAPSSVTQTLNVDCNVVGQIIIDVEDKGVKLIDSDQNRYVFASNSMTIFNADTNVNPIAIYGVSSILLSTMSSLVDIHQNSITLSNTSSLINQFLAADSFETSLVVNGGEAALLRLASTILIESSNQNRFYFGSNLTMQNVEEQANPVGIYAPSSILLSTPTSLVDIHQNSITLLNTSSFVNQFLGTGRFETSLVTEGEQTAILTLASTTVLEDNYQTRYSFGSSNFIIKNINENDNPTAFVSPSTIFVSSISSLAQINDRSLTITNGESNLFNIYVSPDRNYTNIVYNSTDIIGEITFLSSIGGVQIRDIFGNPSYFASNAFTTANINADNITTRTLTARTIRVISTIYSESTISTVVLLADSAVISSIIGGDPNGDLNITSTRHITETATGITMNASNGFDVLNPGYIRMNTGGGNYGEITMVANPGIAGNYGRVSITANGGQNDLIGLGGLVEITATTPIGTSPPLTSAIKFSAAGINSYAGAIPSIGSLPGYNFIYGTAGVNICTGIPSIVPNIPLTTFLYGTAGVVIGSDMYASAIYGYWAGIPYAPSNLLIAGRQTVAGDSFVVLSNVSSINGQAYPPPASETLSTFVTASISSLTVSSINGEQYPPNIETLSTFQNIYVASTIQVASSISFVGGNGVIQGVSSISTNALLANQAQITSLSTFEATIDKMTVLEEVRVSSGGTVYVETGSLVEFLSGTGEILGVSSINNIPYPPPAGDAVSTFSSLTTNSFFAVNANISSISSFEATIDKVTVLEEVRVSSGGTIYVETNSLVEFLGGTGNILGVSSINNIAYPPPAGDAVSTFQTASISSLAASTISTNFVAMTNAFVSKEINISSGGLLGLYDGSEIIFYGATNTGVIVGVSSINNTPYPPPVGDTISTFSTFFVSSLTTSFTYAENLKVNTELLLEPGSGIFLNTGAPINFITSAGSNTGEIQNVSSINNIPYPPPAGDAISTFSTFFVSSLGATNISTALVNVSEEILLGPAASLYLDAGANIYFVTSGGNNVGVIENVSSINNLPYPPPAAETISTFQTASISSLTVSSINGGVYPPPATEFISSFSTLNVSSIISTASLIVSSINNAPYPPPANELISSFSTLFVSSFISTAILRVSSINDASYPPPAISTFSTLIVSSISSTSIFSDSITTQFIEAGSILGKTANIGEVTSDRVSTQALYFSSFNDYGFSTLSEWNVAPTGYAVTGSNNKFYLGQSNIINVVTDVNDRFMLYCGNVNFGFPSTLISSVIAPGAYSPPDFVTAVQQSISTANGNYITGGGNSNYFRDILFAKTSAYNDVLYGVATQDIPAVNNYAIGTGLGFFSTTTGYGAPIVPLTILSSCASLVGSYFGSSIGFPDTVPLPYPQFYPAQFTGVAATAVEITLTEGGYSPAEIVTEIQTQFNSKPFPFNQARVQAVNQIFDEYGNVVSQGLQFSAATLGPPYFSLGFSFLNSGGANAYWDLNTVSNDVLNGAATFLGFAPATQVTWSNFNGGFVTGSNTNIGAPIPFGSNMEFNSVDVLTLRTSTLNGYSFKTIATQNGIASNFTITDQNNSFLIGYSNIHNVINGYNNRFFITGRLSGDKYQEIVEIPAGLYDHLQFISTINPLISSTQAAFPTVWPPGEPGGAIAIEISSISSYYTTYAISTVLFADTLGVAFSTWSDQSFDSGTLAIVSTTANLFGMTASTILASIDPVTFPSYSRTGGRSTIQLTPGTYSLQSLSDSINQSATSLGFPYDNLSTKIAFVPNPDGSVSEGNLILFGNNSSNQAFAGFSSNLDYPFAYPPVIVPGLAATASTLGFNNGYVVNQDVTATGSTITGTASYFGSNMQFNIVNINELHTSSINGQLAEGIAYQDTAASFSSIAISSIDAGVILSQSAFIFQEQAEQLIVSSLTGVGATINVIGNIDVPSLTNVSSINGLPPFLSTFSTFAVSSLTVSKEVATIVSTQQLFVSSINGLPPFLSTFSTFAVSSLTVSKEVATIVSTQQLFVSSINGQKYLPSMVIQAAGTTALTVANANTTYLLTSGTTQNFTTAALGAGNAGLYWYVKNSQPAGGSGDDVTIQHNGTAITGATSTAHQNTNTANSSLMVIYWNGTDLIMY